MANAYRVESKDNEGKDKVIVVKKPGHQQLTDAQFYSASIFNKARQAGVSLRSKLDEYMIKEGVWSDSHNKRAEELTKLLDKNIRMLRAGKKKDGTKMKLSEGKKLAISIRRDRLELNLILAKRREYDAYTVEGQAENARFDYLVSVCSFNEDGGLIFADIDDYYDKKDEPYAFDAAAKLASIVFNVEDGWEKDLEENKFLLKHKFVDESLRYINKEGKFTNADGELVDEFGRRVDENGKILDWDGVPIVETDEDAEFENDLD